MIIRSERKRSGCESRSNMYKKTTELGCPYGFHHFPATVQHREHRLPHYDPVSTMNRLHQIFPLGPKGPQFTLKGQCHKGSSFDVYGLCLSEALCESVNQREKLWLEYQLMQAGFRRHGVPDLLFLPSFDNANGARSTRISCGTFPRWCFFVHAWDVADWNVFEYKSKTQLVFPDFRPSNPHLQLHISIS